MSTASTTNSSLWGEAMERLGVKVAGVVVTQHKETDRVEEFVTQCEHRGFCVHKHASRDAQASLTALSAKAGLAATCVSRQHATL